MDERARAFLAAGSYATVAIDRYDDLPAVFGKIDAAASPRVALVAARGNQELQRALSMRRLQRHLDLHGKDLILVSRSRALRLRAREEGLPAVGTLRSVDFGRTAGAGLHLGWLTLRRPSLGTLLAPLLLALALLGGFVTLFWYLPEGNVTVYLPATIRQEALDFTLNSLTSEVNLETRAIPAHRREVTVTRSVYRPATGVVQVPVASAAVALRFTNRTAAAIRVPKGTVVTASNNVRFTTGGDIDLPRLTGVADVVALAQQPGTIGNVPPNSATKIEGDLAGRLTVTNPAPGEKGVDRPLQVVSQADVEGVRSFAEPLLIDAAKADLLQRLADSSTVFGASAVATVTDLRALPPVNEPAAYTEVKLTGKVTVLTADDADLRQLYVQHFLPVIPPGEMLLDDQFSTTVERTGESDRPLDLLPLTARVTAVTAPSLDRADLARALAGHSRSGAERVVRDRLGPTTPPVVKISPGWAPRLPRKSGRITVIFLPAPAAPAQ